MQDGGVHKIEIVLLLLLLFVAAFGALACKLKTPYPIVLVIAGLLLGFVPGIPRITLNPDIIFFRGFAAASLLRSLASSLARVFLQSGQHHFSGVRSGYL